MAAANAALGACAADRPTAPPIELLPARVRFVHALGGASPLAVQFDAAGPVVAGLAFGQVSPGPGQYFEVSAGTRRVRLVDGAGRAAVDSALALGAGGAYLVVAVGGARFPAGGWAPDSPLAPGLLVLDLRPTGAALPRGSVRLRVVHAASNVADADVYVVRDPGLPVALEFPADARVAGGLAYRATTTVTLPFGRYAVCVVGAGVAPGAGGRQCVVRQTAGDVGPLSDVTLVVRGTGGHLDGPSLLVLPDSGAA